MAKREINKKKNDRNPSGKNNKPKSQAGYAAQDFEQGRKGTQSGHLTTRDEVFSQFENAGRGGFAGERQVNK